ncbi:hypothetical protein P4O66_013504 [Electrophorus voltai]|uniref:Uncharacterized protein n=1 Tax=Electrophorus voltai TaxID=2609070 RepID=A0AAD9DTU0_9TELE|nr:hypothetical protein P4O66_013504 [Electrophorus voltai]
MRGDSGARGSRHGCTGQYARRYDLPGETGTGARTFTDLHCFLPVPRIAFPQLSLVTAPRQSRAFVRVHPWGVPEWARCMLGVSEGEGSVGLDGRVRFRSAERKCSALPSFCGEAACFVRVAGPSTKQPQISPRRRCDSAVIQQQHGRHQRNGSLIADERLVIAYACGPRYVESRFVRLSRSWIAQCYTRLLGKLPISKPSRGIWLAPAPGSGVLWHPGVLGWPVWPFVQEVAPECGSSCPPGLSRLGMAPHATAGETTRQGQSARLPGMLQTLLRFLEQFPTWLKTNACCSAVRPSAVLDVVMSWLSCTDLTALSLSVRPETHALQLSATRRQRSSDEFNQQEQQTTICSGTSQTTSRKHQQDHVEIPTISNSAILAFFVTLLPTPLSTTTTPNPPTLVSP